jgi:hypothetical protein
MKCVCFSPNDAIWRWTFPQAAFLEALKRRGDKVIYMHCDRTLSKYCMVMAVHGVAVDAPDEVRERCCTECVRVSGLVRDKYGFTGVALHSLLESDEIAMAEALSQQKSVEELIAYSSDGIPVGQIALYEAVIQSKHISRKIDGLAEKLYRPLFRNSILIAKATARLLKQEKPDVCATYHAAYAYNRSFQKVSEAAGIPVYSLNSSFNMDEQDSHLVIARDDPEQTVKKMIAAWPRFKDKICSKSEIDAVTTHLVALLSGRGLAYSVPVGAGEKSVDAHGRKIVLVVLSSYDELFACELAGFGWSTYNDTFGSQVEWVEWLLQYAAEKTDVKFVIRVHPREFPINGKGHRSAHVGQLLHAFAKRPDNVFINMPSDRIPIYELMLEADAVLVAWSSAGMEAGMFGIPVVSYFADALGYPPSLLFEARSREQYRDCIEKALSSPWSLERSRSFFRWGVLSLVRTRIRVSNEGYGANPFSHNFKRVLRYVRRRLTPWSDQDWQILLRRRRLVEREKIYTLLDGRHDAFYSMPQSGESEPSLAAETRALAGGLARVAAIYERKSGRQAQKLRSLIRQAMPAGRKHFDETNS